MLAQYADDRSILYERLQLAPRVRRDHANPSRRAAIADGAAHGHAVAGSDVNQLQMGVFLNRFLRQLIGGIRIIQRFIRAADV